MRMNKKSIIDNKVRRNVTLGEPMPKHMGINRITIQPETPLNVELDVENRNNRSEPIMSIMNPTVIINRPSLRIFK